MKFITLRPNLKVNIDEIEAVEQLEDGMVVVKTQNNVYRTDFTFQNILQLLEMYNTSDNTNEKIASMAEDISKMREVSKTQTFFAG